MMKRSRSGCSDKRREDSCEIGVVVVVVVAAVIAVEPWPRSNTSGSMGATCVFASGFQECPLRMTVDYGRGWLYESVTC